MQQTLNITFYQSVSIVVFLLLICTFLLKGIFNTFFKKRFRGSFWRTKVEAEAIVLSINQGISPENRKPKIKMQMQVQPERGRNFVVELNEAIPSTDLDKYSVGTKIRVRFNPRNTKEITLVKQEIQKEPPFAK